MWWVQSIAAQLHAAMVIRGWSVPQLLRESGLDLDRTSLQRKLKGKQILSTDEAEKLASVLSVSLILKMRRSA